jgi:thiol-disulfide isomerase/thioredoxin
MRRLVVNVVAMVALLAGFYLSARYYAEPVAAPVELSDGSLVGSLRPDFTLSSNTGEIVTPAIFSGKTVLVNFWATWCAPCRHEMPMLMDLQKQYAPMGLQVVGIALDDEQSVKNFVSTYGISYPILVGDADVFKVSAAYGNTEGVLPYSVLVDKDGIVRWQYAGKVRSDDISNLLSEFL